MHYIIYSPSESDTPVIESFELKHEAEDAAKRNALQGMETCLLAAISLYRPVLDPYEVIDLRESLDVGFNTEALGQTIPPPVRDEVEAHIEKSLGKRPAPVKREKASPKVEPLPDGEPAVTKPKPKFMECPHCRKANKAEREFCTDCEKPLHAAPEAPKDQPYSNGEKDPFTEEAYAATITDEEKAESAAVVEAGVQRTQDKKGAENPFAQERTPAPAETPATPPPPANTVETETSLLGMVLKSPPAEWEDEPITSTDDAGNVGQITALNAALTNLGYGGKLRHKAVAKILCFKETEEFSLNTLSKSDASLCLSWIEKATASHIAVLAKAMAQSEENASAIRI